MQYEAAAVAAVAAVAAPGPCPGLFCGRMLDSGGLECGSCPWGYRREEQYSHWCRECGGDLPLYDWLYLGFMALLNLMFQCLIIDVQTRRKALTMEVIALHCSALAESTLALLVTLLSFRPVGALTLVTCGVKDLRDWYPLFFNPKPDYVNTVHCTQEVVYPLYTIPMVYYSFSLLFLIISRTVIVNVFKMPRVNRAVCATLYLFPILVFIQAVFGGLLYYSYPYILLVLVLISNAWHLASQTEDVDLSIRELLLLNIADVKNVLIVLSHWLLLAYAIVSLTQLQNLRRDLALLSLVPAPTLFYILTVKYSTPAGGNGDSRIFGP